MFLNPIVSFTPKQILLQLCVVIPHISENEIYGELTDESGEGKTQEKLRN